MAGLGPNGEFRNYCHPLTQVPARHVVALAPQLSHIHIPTSEACPMQHLTRSGSCCWGATVEKNAPWLGQRSPAPSPPNPAPTSTGNLQRPHNDSAVFAMRQKPALLHCCFGSLPIPRSAQLRGHSKNDEANSYLQFLCGAKYSKTLRERRRARRWYIQQVQVKDLRPQV